MAIEIIQTSKFIDDLNKLPYIEGETVQFSYDGITYRLDLNKRNAETFHRTMQKYASVGKAVRRNAVVGYDPGQAPDGNMKHIREWARKNDLPINMRGRIPASVMELYQKEISNDSA